MSRQAPYSADERAELITFARRSIERGSRSFAAASRLFARDMRERVWLLYAWCRACDDLADGQDHGGGMSSVDDPEARLAHIRQMTARAMAGRRTGEPAFDCLGLVAAQSGLTLAMANAVIDGFALDAEGWRPRSEADLYRYCYHVAGAVGVMMAVVMGVDPDDDAVLDRACDLGIAFQLSNIARDLMEDDAAGRCYLPVEWLVEADIPPGEHMKPMYRPALVRLARRLTDAAALYETSARRGAYALPFRARWAVLAAAGIYGDIGRKVAAAGAHGWDSRIHSSAAEKAVHIAAALKHSTRPPHGTDKDRAGLWSRSDLERFPRGV